MHRVVRRRVIDPSLLEAVGDEISTATLENQPGLVYHTHVNGIINILKKQETTAKATGDAEFDRTDGRLDIMKQNLIAFIYAPLSDVEDDPADETIRTLINVMTRTGYKNEFEVNVKSKTSTHLLVLNYIRQLYLQMYPKATTFDATKVSELNHTELKRGTYGGGIMRFFEVATVPTKNTASNLQKLFNFAKSPNYQEEDEDKIIRILQSIGEIIDTAFHVTSEQVWNLPSETVV
jgi:hypothetical protein